MKRHFLWPKGHTSSSVLDKWVVMNLCTYVHVRLWKVIDLGLAVQHYECCLMEDDGWVSYQSSATNRLKKCRFGFCTIFSRYPVAESRSQKRRDDRTLRTQRLWSDILMLLSLNHWDMQRRTHRYSKGDPSFTFNRDIWDGTHQMFWYCFYCVGCVKMHKDKDKVYLSTHL